MPFTIYDACVPIFDRMLSNLSKILVKAEAYASQSGLDLKVLLQSRLYADMFPLVRQVQIACDHAKGATARLAGIEPPRFADNETTFGELRGRIDRTLAFVAGASATAIQQSAARPIVLKLGGNELEFTGKEYLLSFALPNFFFHVTTAYDILRHSGVDIGKRDYLG